MRPEAPPALPPIPAKRYFTIGEVSELCGVKPHVLRYWEQEFPQLKPVKRRGNRRWRPRRCCQSPHRRLSLQALVSGVNGHSTPHEARRATPAVAGTTITRCPRAPHDSPQCC